MTNLQINIATDSSILFMSTLASLNTHEQEQVAECLQSYFCEDVEHCKDINGRHIFYMPFDYCNLETGADNLNEERLCIQRALEPTGLFEVTWKMYH